MNNQSDKVTGYILAGGSSVRFGSDKRLAQYEGKSFVCHAINIVKSLPLKGTKIVGDNLESLDLKGLPILADAAKGKGPLGGLVAALRDCETDWLLLIGIDTPMLDVNSLKSLLAVNRDKLDLLMLTKDDHPEPLAALYSCKTLDFWSDRLEDGKLALHEGIRQLRSKTLKVEDSSILENINTTEDYSKLRSKQ